MFDAKKVKSELLNWIRETVGDSNVVIGISGGKDSSITAALCVEALGKDKVYGVLMPQNVQLDIDKAQQLVDILGIKNFTVNIGSTYNELTKCVHEAFCSSKENCYLPDLYTTNTPARIRMTVLYGVAALIGNSRVANTCNLSEDYVGYATKYGDGAGDFSPLSDLTVTEVKQIGYELGLPKELIEKIPDDGMCGQSDEEKLGFTYAVLDKYIRTGEIEDLNTKNKIDRLHLSGLHKLVPMPKFIHKEL